MPINPTHIAWKRAYQLSTSGGKHTRAIRIGSALGTWTIVGGGYNHGHGKTPAAAWRNACEGAFGEQHLEALKSGSWRP